MQSERVLAPSGASVLAGPASLTRNSSVRLLRPKTAYARYGAELDRLARRASPALAMTFSAAWADALPPPASYARRLLLLHEQGELRAALSFRARTLLGFSTGVLHGGDAKGEGLVLCEPGEETKWLGACLAALFSSRRCAALWMERTEAGGEALKALQPQLAGARLRTVDCAAPAFWQTDLHPRFDETLRPFGHRTRRNLRHARRRVADNNWTFIPKLSREEAVQATLALAERSTHPYSANVVAARVALELSQENGFSAGIHDAEGIWLSVVTGARRDGGITDIFWQANAPHYPDSLALSMRAVLMEHEGQRGSQRLRLIGGTSPLLEHCCRADPGRHILITRPGLRLSLIRAALRTRWAARDNPLAEMLRNG